MAATPGAGGTPAAGTPGHSAGTPGAGYYAESASPGSAANYSTPGGGYGDADADGGDGQEQAVFVAGTCVSLTSGDEGVVSSVRGAECTVLVDGSYVDVTCESLTFVRPKKGDKVSGRGGWGRGMIRDDRVEECDRIVCALG